VCSQGAVERYRSKLSGPILDRVDLFIHVPRVKIEDFEAKKKTQTITSESLRSLVFGARERQKTRFVGTTKTYNSEMTNEDVDRFCVLGKDEDVFVKNAVSRLDLSTRAYFRLLKLARTIADIEGSDDIRLPHLAEALGYRKIDDKK
jgi:magnesium chelatase family protein